MVNLEGKTVAVWGINYWEKRRVFKVSISKRRPEGSGDRRYRYGFSDLAITFSLDKNIKIEAIRALLQIGPNKPWTKGSNDQTKRVTFLTPQQTSSSQSQQCLTLAKALVILYNFVLVVLKNCDRYDKLIR